MEVVEDDRFAIGIVCGPLCAPRIVAERDLLGRDQHTFRMRRVRERRLHFEVDPPSIFRACCNRKIGVGCGPADSQG